MNEEIIKKLCKYCLVEKELSEFYTQMQGGKLIYQTGCRQCRKDKIKSKRLELYEDEGYYYYSQPFKYFSTTQEEDVKEILITLGWIWNEEKELWWKPGIKDINGKWIKQNKQ